MKKSFKIIVTLLLALVVAAALLPLSATVRAESGDSDDSSYIMIKNEFAVWRGDPEGDFFLYDNYEGILDNRQGFVYDPSTNTMTITNIDYKNECFVVDIYNMSNLTIKVVGNCGIASLHASDTNLYFTGNGVLQLAPYMEFYEKPEDKEPVEKGYFMGTGLVLDNSTARFSNTVTVNLNREPGSDPYLGVAEIISPEEIDEETILKTHLIPEGNVSEKPILKDEYSEPWDEPTIKSYYFLRYISYEFPAVYTDQEGNPGGNIYYIKGSDEENNYYINSNLDNYFYGEYYMVKLIFDERIGAWVEKMEQDPDEPGKYLDAHWISHGDSVEGLEFEEYLDASQLPDTMVDDKGNVHIYARDVVDTAYEVYLKDGEEYTMANGYYYNWWIQQLSDPAEPELHYGLGGPYAGTAIFKICEENGFQWLQYVEEIPISYDPKEGSTPFYAELEEYMKDHGYEIQKEVYHHPGIHYCIVQNTKLSFTPSVKKVTGLYNLDGTWKYYENGVFTKAKGMVKCPDKNKWYYVENGVIAKKTGMVQRITDKKWFYVENGVYNNKVTGVVQRVDNKKYFYVKNGKYDNTFTGVATGVTDKKTYYITKGQLKAVTGVFADGKKWKYFVDGKFSASTGVVARSADKKWVYIDKGIVTASTGMAKRLTDNKWVYVEKGVLAKKTGLVQRISDKKWFYVQNGVFNNKYTGGVKRVSDNKWFYVEKGQLKKSTGLAKCTDGKYRYFKSGSFNKLTGKAKLIGGGSKQYNVKNGILVK